MALETWIVAGLGVGALASRLVVRSGEGLPRDLALGVVGAVCSGWFIGDPVAAEAAELNVFGVIVSIAGASALLIAYHTLFPRVTSAPPAPPD